MKSLAVVFVLVVALIASTAAKIDLFFEHTELHPGSTYKLEWETDHDYTLQLQLVKSLPGGGWTSTSVIFRDMVQQTGHGSWNYSVPFNIEAYDKYGFWILGLNYPQDGWGYANLTNWFAITEPEWRDPGCRLGKAVRGVGMVVVGVVLVTGLAVFGVRRRRERRRAAVRAVLIDAGSDEKIGHVDVVLVKSEC